jgi:hypothetical protein
MRLVGARRPTYILKYLKFGIYELSAFAIITFATLLRVLLAALNWPQTNSDEGTFGIMAMHIAFRGERPLFFYGQYYLGAFDAYIGAALFHVFGVSVFTLRLGPIILFALFMMVMYLLTSVLYTKKMALATLFLLSIGSIPILTFEFIGGYAEILPFGAAAFLLAVWLALSYGRDMASRRPWLRYLAFACWGLIVGLGIWNDPIILPVVASAGLLLAVFCWRELLKKWGGICLLLGFLIGAFPLIEYNLTAPPGQNSLYILWNLQHPGPSSVIHSPTLLAQQIKGTFLISISTATGNPLCLSSESFLWPTTPPSLHCTIIRGTWGLGFVILLVVAVFLALRHLWKLRHLFREQPSFSEEKGTIIREFARLMLLASAVITLLLYALSTAPAVWPATTSRYLHCLLIATPAIIWPLWVAASAIGPPTALFAKIRMAFGQGMLMLIGVAFVVGTSSIFSNVSLANAITQQQETLVKQLESMGIKHFYTDDYWSCNRVAFQSREQLVCDVINPDLKPVPSKNRYWPYVLIVQSDPHAAYVLPAADPGTTPIVKKAHLASQNYQRFVFDGYIIYLPLQTSTTIPASHN